MDREVFQPRETRLERVIRSEGKIGAIEFEIQEIGAGALRA